MRLARKLPRRFLPLLAALVLILSIEWNAFEVASWLWDLNCSSSTAGARNSTSSHSILLVGDPQLLGYRNEPRWVGSLARWDADRYLRRGYDKVVKTVGSSVELELFLGDLFDEGVEMGDEEFRWTLARFHFIFPARNECSRVYIPGDNDIGGEMEPVYLHLVDRFNRVFPPYVAEKNSRLMDHLALAKLNFFNNYELQPVRWREYERELMEKAFKLRILLSHLPVLRSAYYMIKEQLDRYQPSLIVSAHEHTAEIYLERLNDGTFNRFTPTSTFTHEAKLGEKPAPTSPVVEFQTPTVNYRMGVSKMGYGLLTVHWVQTENLTDPKALIEFRILWLPPRYPLLFLYALLLLLAFLYTFPYRIIRPSLPYVGKR